MRRAVFPFTAVIGQRELKNAIIWNIVNPAIGGLLVSGEKGTAKSTLVRGAAEIACGMDIIEVPLGVTEDRLVGAADCACAIRHGVRRPEKGLLGQADGNILYIDEVNLLGDHITSAILQTAGNRVNIVEREGISLTQSSSFILIGSMNPEEGPLRGHFLDRFGLFVEAAGCRDVTARTAIIEERLKYEEDPLLYARQFADETALLREKISAARKALSLVTITENTIRLAAALAEEAGAEGHRGEIALIETARAIAALDARKTVNIEDLREAAKFALPHRSTAPSPHRDAEEAPPDNNKQEKPEDTSPNEPHDEREAEEPRQERGPQKKNDNDTADVNSADSPVQNGEECGPPADDDIEEAGEPFVIRAWEFPDRAAKKTGGGSGRRERVISEDSRGRYIKYRIPRGGKTSDIAFDATVRAAAPFQPRRRQSGAKTFIVIEKEDLRVKVREKRSCGCIIFVVDASASMGANRRMREVKAAIISLLSLSYQKRDRIGMIAFRKESAEIILGVTSSVELAQKRLRDLPTGGKTPLAKGLDLAYEVVMGLKKREPELTPEIVLVSDGRASGKKRGQLTPFDEALLAAERIGNQGIHIVVIDTENDFIKFHLCDRLNEKLHGTVIGMDELKAEGIIETIGRAAAGR